MRIVEDRGSAMPLLSGFLLLFLYFSIITVNSGSAFLFSKHLQSSADQEALKHFAEGERTSGGTFEFEVCKNWQAPLKAIGLPTEQRICTKSAAR